MEEESSSQSHAVVFSSRPWTFSDDILSDSGTEAEDDANLPHNMVSQCDETCSICLESINSHQSHALDCGHRFHTRCAIDWFRLNGTCPLCRCSDIHAQAKVVDYDEAIRILLRKASNKKAPASLKRAAEALKRKRDELRDRRKELRSFENKSKDILAEMRRKRRRVSRARVGMERAEMGLVMPRTPFKGVTIPLISYCPPVPQPLPPEEDA